MVKFRATKRSSRTLGAQIHKLCGQVSAIEHMVAEKRSCQEVLAQIEAVRSGLSGIAAIIVNEEIVRMAKRKTIESHDIVKLTRTFLDIT
jgi:DNA-binding FrmR family transcriptional regulator